MTEKGKADLKVGNIMLRTREHEIKRACIVFCIVEQLPFTLLPQQIQEQNR